MGWSILANTAAWVWSYTFQGIGTDSSDSDLICCSGEESSKCGTKSNFSSACQSFSDTDKILLCNKAFNKTLWELFFQGDWKSWVLSITIKPNNVWIWDSGIYQTVSVGFSGWNDLTHFVVWSNFNCSLLNLWFFSLRGECFELDFLMFEEGLKMVNDLFSTLSEGFTMPVLLIFDFREILAFESIGNNDFGFSIFLF